MIDMIELLILLIFGFASLFILAIIIILFMGVIFRW